MKRISYLLFFVLAIFLFSSCAANKNTNIAKEYIDEYYQNFSQGNSTQCYYQLNKNSSDILEQKYSISVEDLLSARSKILGPVESYEIISQEYLKEDTDKFVELEMLVQYKNAKVNEKHQIIIKKDGQTSINTIEFEDDNVIDEFISLYKNALIKGDANGLLELVSEQYFDSKTERNFGSMIEQAKELGGKLLSCEIIEENYYYQSLNIGSYVYEALLELKYENKTMQNKIKITGHNEELGIGYTMILPKEILTFFEDYTSYLSEQDKEGALSMYNPEMFEGDQGKKDSKWEVLMSYSEAYGDIVDYEVLSIGSDSIEMPDGTILETMKAESVINYKNQPVKNKIVLIKDSTGKYIIFEQHISDD